MSNGSQVTVLLIPSSSVLKEEIRKDLAALNPCTSVGGPLFLLEALWGGSSRINVCKVSGYV